MNVIEKILLDPCILLTALQDSDECKKVGLWLMWRAGACLMLLMASENDLLSLSCLLIIYDLRVLKAV